MNGVVVIDANLLVLLVVGSTSRDYIPRHKRLSGYSEADYDVLTWLIGQFEEIVLLPHLLSEASGLCRQIANPARRQIGRTLATLIATNTELLVPSAEGIDRDEFDELGLTDAIILHLCAMQMHRIMPTLITADRPLADRAHSLGYSVIDFKEQFQSG